MISTEKKAQSRDCYLNIKYPTPWRALALRDIPINKSARHARPTGRGLSPSPKRLA